MAVETRRRISNVRPAAAPVGLFQRVDRADNIAKTGGSDMTAVLRKLTAPAGVE